MKRHSLFYTCGNDGAMEEDPNGEWVNFKDAKNLQMELLDYFAAKALQAAATNPAGAEGFSFSERAAWAYLQADAMLTERTKRKN